MRQLMQYRIISGRTMEIRRGLFSIGSTYRKPRGTRKAGASSLKKIKANEKSCERNCARKINCNFTAGDGYLTMKYDGDHLPESYEQAEEKFGKFLRRLRKEYRRQSGEKLLPEVWVTANWSPKRQAEARLHHHIVLPSSAIEIARKLWAEFGGAGTVWIRELDDEGDYSRLASYMVENVKGLPAGKQRWHCSRGMVEPTITELEPVDDVENLQPDRDSVVKEVEETLDEDGRVVGKYLRCVWKEAPRVRGGQVILNKRPGRRKAG